MWCLLEVAVDGTTYYYLCTVVLVVDFVVTIPIAVNPSCRNNEIIEVSSKCFSNFRHSALRTPVATQMITGQLRESAMKWTGYPHLCAVIPIGIFMVMVLCVMNPFCLSNEVLEVRSM
jgi:hypothetical protein